jgi:hypothetical protein
MSFSQRLVFGGSEGINRFGISGSGDIGLEGVAIDDMHRAIEQFGNVV